MRKIIISFCILLSALSLQAQSVSGIRIDGGNTPILVYFGGNQMCLPTTTCFVANLDRGYYTVEVYATRFTRPGERVWKGERLYNERVYFDGRGVKDIFVDDRHDRVMNDQLFKTFYNNLKKEPFEDDRMALLNTALANSDFTSAQCLQVTKLYTFDDDRMTIMKKMYPRIVDKEAFFTVIATLTFSSNKDEMNKFVQNYGRR